MAMRFEADLLITAEEATQREHKELRGMAILEHRLERQHQSSPCRQDEAEREAFRKRCGYEWVIGMADVIRVLRGDPS